MTRVDFYILPEDNRISPLLYAARLVEKAFRRGHQIYVHTLDEAQTRQLSDALWQRPDSILGHSCGQTTEHQPIQVSHQGEPGEHGDVMVNLAGTIPTFFSRFQRVAEIVPGKPESRSQSRDNFRFYKERGYALKTHNI
ncbi:MAG: DNA polymerase III subunit chi [Pseudomonadales bacterium]|jgi:DNA polymerase III subunit chi|nr:DNA polymerase III subunit chi [Pseudomonadales bacterium]MCK5791708.1 DNA polymerase III subunit chi [Ketobacter sp.]MEC8813516.1 DNA polymerase III subunit chi [Pseudomonadota bacterium]HAU16187.1 DNA polymerase III subunit chi [Gammaproteobacteria bacterium]MAQ27312.1 DNA polymerase III subunit chi [Pseudomonadales bacterium]|tara:strand:- start:146 stop:562 length:417 start_codon:yes stop_codon:yes gene_type:complete